MTFKKLEFMAGYVKYRSVPGLAGREVAFAGRSNAGKSSALNALAGRKALAKVSGTPGKTREINLFKISDTLRICDLPGYGYAKVSAVQQQEWGQELTDYILRRDCLAGLVIVMDIRHPFSEKDRSMMDLALAGGRKIHILLNKADKLSKSKQNEALKKAKKTALGYNGIVTLQVFSSFKKTGLVELSAKLTEWFTEKI